MFQRINKKINTSFELTIPKGKDEIFISLRQKVREQGALSFMTPGHIDFSEVKFIDQGIEILRKPGTFSPFRPFGKILITFTEISLDKTKLKCDVMPGNNTIPILFVIQTLILFIFAMGWMMGSGRLDPWRHYGVPLGIVLIPTTISILKYRSDRLALIDYMKMVIQVMRG